MAFPARKPVVLTQDTELDPGKHMNVFVSGTDVTISLPENPIDNDAYQIMNIKSGSTVTIDGNGETVNGESSITISYKESVGLQKICSGWWGIGGSGI